MKMRLRRTAALAMTLLLLGLLVLVVIVALKHFTKGITSTSCILCGIIAGYIAASVMGLALPHTLESGANAAWYVNWSKVGEAAWFSVWADVRENSRDSR